MKACFLFFWLHKNNMADINPTLLTQIKSKQVFVIILAMMNLFFSFRKKRNRDEFMQFKIKQRRCRLHYIRRRDTALKMFLYLKLSRQRKSKEIWSKPKNLLWWDSIVHKTFTDADWHENFRMSKKTFDEICQIVEPYLLRQTTRLRSPIAVDKQVAIAIWRLATNVEYRTISHLFGVGRTTVFTCVREFCSAMVCLKNSFLRIPDSEEFREIASQFKAQLGFPQCVGAIDGTHIPILAPCECHTDYFNRKGWHSIILQAIVDAQGKFWDVCIGFPGSAHDARVLRNSTIWELAEKKSLFPFHPQLINGNMINYFIIGDPAYPLRRWLLKPYSENGRLNAQQLNFNIRLSSARSVVERAFGRLKARWRCLLKRNDCHLDFLPVLVMTCCILHNICEKNGDKVSEEWLNHSEVFEQPNTFIPHREECIEGEELRKFLSQYFHI